MQWTTLSWKLKATWKSITLAQKAFTQLDSAVSSRNKQLWQKQEEAALRERVDDCTVMDMFEIQSAKTPTVHGVELQLLQLPNNRGAPHGATSWLANGIKIEETELIFGADERANGKYIADHASLNSAQVDEILMDEYKELLAMDEELAELHRKSVEVIKFSWVTGEHWETYPDAIYTDGHNNGGLAPLDLDGEDASEDDGISVDDMLPRAQPAKDPLPLPSTLSMMGQLPSELQNLADMELELQIGQANDALHGLQLALVDKAVIFWNVVWQQKAIQ
ncbi:hypothetical protein EDD15DRAFT_2203627 [Pisolithus albus]|nr:hypothetical protein EDD15DRAFT_2203627 [Pisolithus albus]